MSQTPQQKQERDNVWNLHLKGIHVLLLQSCIGKKYTRNKNFECLSDLFQQVTENRIYMIYIR